MVLDAITSGIWYSRPSRPAYVYPLSPTYPMFLGLTEPEQRVHPLWISDKDCYKEIALKERLSIVAL